MSELISAEARSWIGREGEPVHVEVNRSDIIKYSISTEQQQEKFLNGDEAPAMFLFGALRPIAPLAELGSDGLPKDSFLPDLPLKQWAFQIRDWIRLVNYQVDSNKGLLLRDH